VVFTAQGIGTTDLVFENAQVTDITGSVFTIDQLIDGSIEVEGEGGTPVWETQGSGTASRLNRVHAVSDRNVWTVGNNIMLRTTNGGSGWTDVTGGLGTLTFLSLWAFDQNKALVGGYIPSAGHSKMYRTTNGGSTWNLVYEVDQHWQNTIFMKDQNNGYFFGDAVNQTWVFMKTTDGGLTWSSVATAPASHVNNEYTYGGSAYWWDGNNKIFFVSGEGWFYSSTNLGASWTSVSVLDSPQLSSVAFNGTGTTGLAGTAGSTGRLARSTNSGASWSEITAPASGTIYTIEYDDGKFWILIGTKVYTSQDAGENWDLETTASASLLDIDFVTAAGGVYGWAVGNSGQIVYYSPTSVSFGETITQSIPDECMLCQNYPNPFNPVTTISYGLVNPARITIAIYDMLGQHLETLVDEVKPAGYYRVDWNAAGRASGIYFCQMKAEGKRSLIKLLLTK
jgi:hypothetical protein